MTLGEYYAYARRGLSPAQILNEVHNQAIAQLGDRVTEANCKKLEDFFNAAFYPKEGQSNEYAQRINQLVSQAYEQKYNLALNNFDIGAVSMTYGVQAENLPALIREKHESFVHKERIYVQTIQDRLARVKSVLDKISEMPNMTEQLSQQETELRSLATQLSELLNVKTSGSDSRGLFLNIKNDPNLFNQVQAMDNAFASLSQVGGVFSPADYGQILEWTLQAFSAEAEPIIEQIADDLIETHLNKIMNTAGSQTVGKSGNDGIKLASVKATSNIQVNKSKGKRTTYTINSSRGSFSFESVSGFNPNTDRQGKMDVNFTFNDTTTGTKIPFRISAKNWSSTDRDFGQTQLAYALIRSLGLEEAQNYLYVMQDAQSSGLLDGYHRLAKYAALIDILMGFSQKNNYADTIFLNIRSESRVRVFSISALLNKINADLDNFTVSGYDSGTIHNQIMAIRSALSRNEGRSEQFESLGMKYLQATQVRIQYAAISGYMG